MSTGGDQQTPEVLGQALLAELNALPIAEQNSDKAMHIVQQILPIDTLREIDADEAQAERLLVVQNQAGLFSIFYGWLLYIIAQEGGLTGFLYQKAGKAAAFSLAGLGAASVVSGVEFLATEWFIKEGLHIAQVTGAVAHEAEGLLALGLWADAHQQPDEVVGALHDGLLLVPRAEAQLRSVSPASRLAVFRQLTDKAARTLLTILLSRTG